MVGGVIAVGGVGSHSHSRPCKSVDAVVFGVGVTAGAAGVVPFGCNRGIETCGGGHRAIVGADESSGIVVGFDRARSIAVGDLSTVFACEASGCEIIGDSHSGHRIAVCDLGAVVADQPSGADRRGSSEAAAHFARGGIAYEDSGEGGSGNAGVDDAEARHVGSVDGIEEACGRSERGVAEGQSFNQMVVAVESSLIGILLRPDSAEGDERDVGVETGADSCGPVGRGGGEVGEVFGGFENVGIGACAASSGIGCRTLRHFHKAVGGLRTA